MVSKKHFEAIAVILSKVGDNKTRIWLVNEFRVFLQQENQSFDAERFWNRIAELNKARREEYEKSLKVGAE